MTRPPLAILCLAAAACGSAGNSPEMDIATTSTGAADFDFALQVTVVPANQRTADGDILVLPQTFGGFTQAAMVDLPLNLALDPPLHVTGTVTGEEVTPYAALGGLPSVDGPVPGRVRLVRDDGFATYEVASDEEGTFDVVVNPANYELSAVPDSTSLAPTWLSESIEPGSSRQDLTLEEGQAIYGQITQGASAFGGCRVFAVDDLGHATATTTASADGLYEIRVPPGRWSVVTTGLPDGKDPTLTLPPVDVTEEAGAEVDVEYSASKHYTVTVNVTAEGGEGLDDVPVRFTAIGLDGYDGSLDPQLVLETRTFDGTVDLVLTPGLWQVDVMPDGDQYSPYASPAPIVVRTGQTLPVVLEPLIDVAGKVSDSAGAPLVDARVTCEEEGFAGRSWTTLTGPDGSWGQSLPNVGAECTVVPPGERVDLAPRKQEVLPAETDEWSFLLSTGDLVSGTVTFQGEPEQFAVVQIYTPDGELVSSGLTDLEGAFSIALPKVGE